MFKVIYHLRFLSLKASGRSSDALIILDSLFLFNIIISISPQMSLITYLHAPQGEIKSSVSPATAMALKFLSPSEIALNIAVRSAQSVKL